MFHIAGGAVDDPADFALVGLGADAHAGTHGHSHGHAGPEIAAAHRAALLSVNLSHADGFSVSLFDGKFVAKKCDSRYNILLL